MLKCVRWPLWRHSYDLWRHGVWYVDAAAISWCSCSVCLPSDTLAFNCRILEDSHLPVRTFWVEIVTTILHLFGAVCSALIHGQNVGNIVRNGTEVGGECYWMYRSHNGRVGMWCLVLYKRKGQKCSRKAGDTHFCMCAFKKSCWYSCLHLCSTHFTVGDNTDMQVVIGWLCVMCLLFCHLSMSNN
jgi:hypothetical protein